jgi:hypothetical protein
VGVDVTVDQGRAGMVEGGPDRGLEVAGPPTRTPEAPHASATLAKSMLRS